MIRSKTIAIVCLSLVCATGGARLALAQERMALNSIEKKRWDRAESQLKKALRKDTLNASAKYVYAHYYFTADNPAFQIDSAYRYTLRSLADFRRSDERERERMKRFPLDSLILIRFRERVDSAAFERATRINTEDAYLKFLADYTFAAQRNRAIELRDEVGYFNALKENTYEAFAAYLAKYPASLRAGEAQKKYDRLLYETKTKDKRLKSYETFVREFPSTPYRKDAELQIFELSTAGGTPSAFETFLSRYPKSFFTKRARNILYHLLLENGHEPQSPVAWNDSLQMVFASERKYLVPFFKDGKYGFIDQEGKEVIAPVADEIDKSYLCGNVTDDILAFRDKLVSRNGVVIYQGQIVSFDDLGFGFLRVERDNCSSVIHKSGSVILDCVDEARLLNGKMMAARKNNSWSLYTLTGRKLPAGEWEDIIALGDSFVFRKNKRASLARGLDIQSMFDSPAPKLTKEYDEVKAWYGDRIWVRSGELQGILDQSLTPYIRLDRHVLAHGPQADFAQSSSGYTFFNALGQQSVVFKKVLQNELWTAVKNQTWRLYDPVNSKYASGSYDSIGFIGPFAVARSSDSLRIFFSPNRTADFPSTTTIEFIPGKDSTSFLVASEVEKKTIFNGIGQRLFTAVYDKIQYAGNGIFIVQKKDKSKKDRRGLVSESGKVLLPIEFDAIGSVANGVVTLLKDKKFGLFDISSLRQIKPEYDKNVTRYTSKYLTAINGNLYGFITWDNKPLGEFQFEEIRYWNDSVSWVKKNYQWMLYNIQRQEIVEDQIKDYTLVADFDDEKIAIIHQEGHYGVISNKRDEIIPATLSRIVNVGSAEQPMYFTAKHVEEADIYVVIYYDKNGKLLRRQVYEEGDYARIYCSSK